MSNRSYKVTEQGLEAYMKHNKMAETAIIGETDSGFILKNRNKVESLSKSAVESWMLDHGHIEGQGFNALSQQDQGTFISNKRKNTMNHREQESYQASMKEENLQKYHDQKKSTMAARGRSNAEHHAEPQSVPWKGSKSYPAGGKGTNQ